MYGILESAILPTRAARDRFSFLVGSIHLHHVTGDEFTQRLQKDLSGLLLLNGSGCFLNEFYEIDLSKFSRCLFRPAQTLLR
jgi:hypothetical protein